MLVSLGVMVAYQTLDRERKEEIAMPASVDIEKVVRDGTALLEEVGTQLHPLATRYLQSCQKLEARLRAISSSRIEEVDQPPVSDPPNGTQLSAGEAREDVYPHARPDGDLDLNSLADASTLFCDDSFAEFETMFFSTGWIGVMDD